jgi:hypothetical protein
MARAGTPCCNVLEVDDLISQLTRGKNSIYTSSIYSVLAYTQFQHAPYAVHCDHTTPLEGAFYLLSAPVTVYPQVSALCPPTPSPKPAKHALVSCPPSTRFQGKLSSRAGAASARTIAGYEERLSWRPTNRPWFVVVGSQPSPLNRTIQPSLLQEP